MSYTWTVTPSSSTSSSSPGPLHILLKGFLILYNFSLDNSKSVIKKEERKKCHRQCTNTRWNMYNNEHNNILSTCRTVLIYSSFTPTRISFTGDGWMDGVCIPEVRNKSLNLIVCHLTRANFSCPSIPDDSPTLFPSCMNIFLTLAGPARFDFLHSSMGGCCRRRMEFII